MDYIMASAAYPGLRRIEIDGKTYLMAVLWTMSLSRCC